MKRKDFLQGLSIGAAGLFTNNLFAMEAKPKAMGIQLFTIRDAVAKNLEGALERLAALGYSNLEIYGYNGSFFGKTAKEFKKILSNTGLKVISSHHMSGMAMKGEGTLTQGWDKAVEDLHSLGAKYMACAYLLPEERTEASYKSLPAILETAAKKAKPAGIQFAYHNHDFEFEKLENGLAYDYIIKNTSPGLVNMELDLYWINKAGHDPVAYFNKYPGRFPLWHVKDMEAGTKDITEVGNGTINFDRIFAARQKAGLKYWFVEQDISKGDIFDSIKTSRAYLLKKNY